MINPMIHVNDYNKLSDIIMPIGRTMTLKFSVFLSYEDKQYGQQSFHKEYKYFSNKTKKNMYTLSRMVNCALIIENNHSAEVDKDYINIGYNDMTPLIYMVSGAMDWFMKPEYANMFASKNGRLVLVNPPTPKRIYINGKYIELEPAIYVDYANNTDLGLRLYLNSDINYTEMSFSNFCGFHYFVTTFNMYQAAQALLNYIQRPDLGTNLVSFSDGHTNMEEHKKQPEQKTGRKINVFNQQKSLEDKLE